MEPMSGTHPGQGHSTTAVVLTGGEAGVFHGVLLPGALPHFDKWNKHTALIGLTDGLIITQSGGVNHKMVER